MDLLGDVDDGHGTTMDRKCIWEILACFAANLGSSRTGCACGFSPCRLGPSIEVGRKDRPALVMIVMAGTAGLVAALGMNLFESVRLALHGSGPAFPPEFDQRLLAVMSWGFMVPFVWGFSTKWLPVFLGLRPTKIHLMLLEPC
jgi:hypothetical protein